jgi:hypothetical protein
MLLPFLLNLGLLTAFAVALYALRASLGGAHAAFAGVGFVTGMSMIVTALALRVAQRGVAALEV